LVYDIIEYYMAIPEKKDDECCQVKVDLCGEAKRIVKLKQDELKAAKMPYGKEFAIVKLILGK
jgi:hypothetical protein